MTNNVKIQLNPSKRLYVLLSLLFLLPVFFSGSVSAQDVEIFKPNISSRKVINVNVKLPFAKKAQSFKAEVVDGFVILEGDIIIGREVDFNGEKAAVIEGHDYRWPNGIIPYKINGGHSRAALIREAIAHINEYTNLSLVPRTSQSDYVSFNTGSGCSSWVGRQGGQQDITIGRCGLGSIIHEIAHAAGAWHEQSRSDRDRYITINWSNIETGREGNFQKYDVGSDIGAYDYNSIMHYPEAGFSRNGRPTIEIKRPPGTASTRIGQRGELSSGDVQGINYMYPVSSGSCTADVHGHKLNSDGKVGRKIIDKTWSNGWTTANFYTVGANQYLFLLKKSDGTVHIHKVESDGTIGRSVERHDWSSGWTTAKFYTMGTKTFLFLMKERDGKVHIHEMKSNGKVGRSVQNHDWSSGWSTVNFYTVGTRTFLFLMKKSNGKVHIHEMNSNGKVGRSIQNHDWSSGWTTANFYTIGTKTFLFLMKKSNGIVHIHEMNSNGKVGRSVQNHDWSNGWTTANFYTAGSKTFLFLMKKSNGIVHIHEMNSNGKVGRSVQNHDWSNGWSTANPYKVGSQNYLFLLKSCTR